MADMLPWPPGVEARQLCIRCGLNLAFRVVVRGKAYQYPDCQRCRGIGPYRPTTEKARHQRLRAAVGRCEVCGFVPEHDCQLDVDHRDGNHTNAAPANLQVLCANCHRLKTMRNRDTTRRYVA